jgi:hypothetical protein
MEWAGPTHGIMAVSFFVIKVVAIMLDSRKGNNEFTYEICYKDYYDVKPCNRE